MMGPMRRRLSDLDTDEILRSNRPLVNNFKSDWDTGELSSTKFRSTAGLKILTS